MTIFPTHKTEFKTNLSRQEVIDRLECNDFYFPGAHYELKKYTGYHELITVNENKPSSNKTFRSKIVINPEAKGSTVKLSFYPDDGQNIMNIMVLVILLVIQAVLIIASVNKGFLSTAIFIPAITAPAYYIIQLIFFSVMAITLRKQIEEHIEAEKTEIPIEETSKLQQWYEKDREPFKFRNK